MIYKGFIMVYEGFVMVYEGIFMVDDEVGVVVLEHLLGLVRGRRNDGGDQASGKVQPPWS